MAMHASSVMSARRADARRKKVLQRFPKETQDLWNEFEKLSLPWDNSFCSNIMLHFGLVILWIVHIFIYRKVKSLEEIKNELLTSFKQEDEKYYSLKNKPEIKAVLEAFKIERV
jgi:hypothetical protein